MSNLIINISFGAYHLQVARDLPWLPCVTFNHNVPDRPWWQFSVWQFFGYRA